MEPAQLELIRLGLFLGGLVVFLLLELGLPYRRPSLSKARRWFENLGLTLFNAVIIRLVFSGAVLATAVYVSENRLGLLYAMELPGWARIAITLVFFDFMLYVWHLLNHEMPFLWRFHRVHHSDGNMDVSTSTRFHTGELIISTVIRMGLVYFLGAGPLAVVVFESTLMLCTQFHHSSLRVPAWFERGFWVLFVPPSMHRTHHSVVIRERDSNYGTIFSAWDRFLGTMVKKADQGRLKIGVGAYPHPEKLGLGGILAMPFTPPVR